LDLKLSISFGPHLLEDANQDERWIAIEELVSLAENHIAAKNKTVTAIVKATRNAGRPACSIIAITR